MKLRSTAAHRSGWPRQAATVVGRRLAVAAHAFAGGPDPACCRASSAGRPDDLSDVNHYCFSLSRMNLATSKCLTSLAGKS